ncbi:MAG: DMT family transporter [Rubrivivax sp.]
MNRAGPAWALGVLAMVLFGATLPVTRFALRTADGALSPWFLTCGRVVLAAAASALVLLVLRAPPPPRALWRALALAAAGNALLYPLSLALALQTTGAGHAAVVTALLPLATAVAAALWARDGHARGGPRFWACALLGCALVLAFSLWRQQAAGGPWRPAAVDGVVALGVLAASVGYVYGARVSRAIGAERTICWITLATLPVALPVALATGPAQALPPASWLAFGYLGLVSMWSAFFAWYRALQWGGALRIGQLQALQPFASIAIAWPLLGEPMDAVTLTFAAAVVGAVWVGTRH